MPTDDATIVNLQTHIRELEQEIVDTKRMVNRLLVRKGQQAMYSEASFGADIGNVFAIRSDQFYGQPLSTAIREYLKMRWAANLGAATVTEIYDALSRGGFAYDTENEDNRKRNLRISLTKNSALFHRLKNGTHFGLPDWYETIPKGDEEPQGKGKGKKNKGRSKSKAAKKHGAAKALTEAATNGDETQEPKASGDGDSQTNGEGNGKTTVIKAVREAILAMKGEFTKQQVVDWIEKRYPDLRAQQRKTSIFSMMANLKGDLKLVTSKAGKGTEPHRFRRSDADQKERAEMN
jgi:hypothetical protein